MHQALRKKIAAGSAVSTRFFAECVKHVNRIKGLLFGQGISGYEPLRKNRRKQLDELHTGDGRPLPTHLKLK